MIVFSHKMSDDSYLRILSRVCMHTQEQATDVSLLRRMESEINSLHGTKFNWKTINSSCWKNFNCKQKTNSELVMSVTAQMPNQS